MLHAGERNCIPRLVVALAVWGEAPQPCGHLPQPKIGLGLDGCRGCDLIHQALVFVVSSLHALGVGVGTKRSPFYHASGALQTDRSFAYIYSNSDMISDVILYPAWQSCHGLLGFKTDEVV
jgi:hypothetical protein